MTDGEAKKINDGKKIYFAHWRKNNRDKIAKHNAKFYTKQLAKQKEQEAGK